MPAPKKGLFRAGALSMVAAGILVLATLPLIPILIPTLAPSTTQSGLQSLQSQGLLYETLWGLYLVSDILYLIAFPALYFALKYVKRGVVLAAVMFNVVFVAIDVGLDIPLRLSLVGLSNSYAAASGNQLVSILMSAQSTLDLSKIAALAATFFQFSAVILASYPMPKSLAFQKGPAYLGAVTGVVSLLFIPAFLLGSQLAGLFNIAGFALLVIWSLLVGNRLRRFG